MGVLEPVRYLLEPWVLMATSAYFLPPTIVRLVRNRQWASVFDWSQFKQAWFATFWRSVGPQVRASSEKIVVPLLQGRTHHGRILEEGEKKKTSPPISGTVVEIGSGSGMWVPVFGELVAAAKHSKNELDSLSAGARHRKSPGSASTSGNITKIYGVEPNASVHQALREQVVVAGLEDVYEILPMGIEDLASSGKAARGSIDCAVCVLCLCGIPEPQYNIRELYSYLKPGGRIYVYEHVRCSRHWSIAWYQSKLCTNHILFWLVLLIYVDVGLIIPEGLLNIFWPQMLGGCQLLRDTSQYLREAGPWSKIDLAQPITEPWYHAVPHIVGVLTK